MSTTIDVSVITGAKEDLIFGCLESLFAQADEIGPCLNVIVTANGASKATVGRLKRDFPQVDVNENAMPRSFAANHNSAIEQTSGAYILVLNDDLIILPGAIRAMLQSVEEHQDVAVVGPRLLNPDGSLQPSTYAFPSLLRAVADLTGVRGWIPFSGATYTLGARLLGPGRSRFWAHDRSLDVDAVKGACFLVRRAALPAVGLMDEVTVAYGEEIEWLYRFRKAGWKVRFCHPAEVIHYGGQSGGATPRFVTESLKGYLNFFSKHAPVAYGVFRALMALYWCPAYLAARAGIPQAHWPAERFRCVIRPYANVFRGTRRFYA